MEFSHLFLWINYWLWWCFWVSNNQMWSTLFLVVEEELVVLLSLVLILRFFTRNLKSHMTTSKFLRCSQRSRSQWLKETTVQSITLQLIRQMLWFMIKCLNTTKTFPRLERNMQDGSSLRRWSFRLRVGTAKRAQWTTNQKMELKSWCI